MMTPSIRVDGLTFRYPGAGRRAVDGMSFEVRPGEVFGFLGPSGAGKTTAQRALLGLVEGWTGSVELFGIDRRRWGRELYDRVGVAFELPVGYPRLTAREDLRHFANLHRRPARDLDGLLDALGLAADADTRVGSYSKGMRVRLNLARALLHDPDLLFLDEPTSGLDPVNAAGVRRIIRDEQERGRTVFLTTHDMGTAEAVCDRVAFVVDGRIEACDTPRQLRLAHGERRLRVEYRDGAQVRVTSFPLHGAPTELVELLRSGRVETMHSTEASLEEVFGVVTGRGW